MLNMPWLLLALAVSGDYGPAPLRQVGRLDHPPIREASGIAASRRYPGVFWVHNDSGNAPALFAVKEDGTLLRQFSVAAPNLDWEDIACDGEGHLFIGDIGNNNGRLRLRTIYRLDEPDPAAPRDAPLALTGTWHYIFPPEGRFDAEGLFIDRGRAILVSKSFDRRPAELFAIPLEIDAPLDSPAIPRSLGRLRAFVEPATGAALSVDGRRLAVCSYEMARVYERARTDSDTWELCAEVGYKADGVEAITWDGDDLILAGEGRGVYRVAAADWKSNRPAAAAP